MSINLEDDVWLHVRFTEPQLRQIAANLYQKHLDRSDNVFNSTAEVLLQCALLRLGYPTVLNGFEGEIVGDYLEELWLEAAEKRIRDAITVRITEAQFEKLREYVDDDCQAHLKAGNRWRLDGGKLRRALELAGIGVDPSRSNQ